MIELGIFQVLRPPVRRNGAFLWLTVLAGALMLAAPARVPAQSADLLRAYQNLESAKAANKVSEALKAGEVAVKLTEEGGDRQGVIELLHGLGDFAAQAGEDRPAAEYYQRALALQESVLGPDHPDLVPVLTALANLKLKDKHYSDAAALEQRILNIERRAYGEHHENVLATLNKLREIYRAGGDAAAVARIDAEAEARGPPPPPFPPPAGDRGLPGIPRCSMERDGANFNTVT
jgi:tetratricopeptide (TPR) repeat protein